MRLLRKIGAKIRNLDERVFGASFVQYHRLLRQEIAGLCDSLRTPSVSIRTSRRSTKAARPESTPITGA